MEIKNKKAYYDYFVEDKYEAGIALSGNEVKSIRDGKCSIKNAYCDVTPSGIDVIGMHVTAWHTSNRFDVDEDRSRRLLLHKSEIRKITRLIQEPGYTLIPLRIYFSGNGKCKMEIGVCRGKKNYDKRRAIKDREISRKIAKY